MRKFIMGDIHGASHALEQCLTRSNFNRDIDLLIQLGDVADGHEGVYDCVAQLLGIKNFIGLRGNHDDWFIEFLTTGLQPDQWKQGGIATAKSYLRRLGKEDLILKSENGYKISLIPADVPPSHQAFFKNLRLYYIDEAFNCFVHGGFNRFLDFKEQNQEDYFWDRTLWNAALSFKQTRVAEGNRFAFRMVTPFKEVFIGHTNTLHWKTDQPMHAANVWNLDTGAGHNGRLTIMEIESHEFWQSDPVTEL